MLQEFVALLLDIVLTCRDDLVPQVAYGCCSIDAQDGGSVGRGWDAAA